jgi:hypothetical protein
MTDVILLPFGARNYTIELFPVQWSWSVTGTGILINQPGACDPPAPIHLWDDR